MQNALITIFEANGKKAEFFARCTSPTMEMPDVGFDNAPYFNGVRRWKEVVIKILNPLETWTVWKPSFILNGNLDIDDVLQRWMTANELGNGTENFKRDIRIVVLKEGGEINNFNEHKDECFKMYGCLMTSYSISCGKQSLFPIEFSCIPDSAILYPTCNID